ncbi:hypothetical protein X975_06574, partial [Stegodyphus mimosarum]
FDIYNSDTYRISTHLANLNICSTSLYDLKQHVFKHHSAVAISMSHKDQSNRT